MLPFLFPIMSLIYRVLYVLKRGRPQGISLHLKMQGAEK